MLNAPHGVAPLPTRRPRLVPRIEDAREARRALSDLIDVEAARPLLRQVLSRLEEGETPPHPLCGGFSLTSGGVEILGLTCCSGPGTLASWKQAVALRRDA